MLAQIADNNIRTRTEFILFSPLVVRFTHRKYTPAEIKYVLSKNIMILDIKCTASVSNTEQRTNSEFPLRKK